jgi:RimJ/RimL family protein N-acetyltransferase
MRGEDFASLLAIFSDPHVMAAFASPPFAPEQMERWLQRNLEHQAQHGFGLFSVLLKQDGHLIGNCGLEVMEVDAVQVAELGYDFHSAFWNHGYATEAATVVRDYAFDKLRLPQLVSLIRVGNQASRRVAEKIGMSLDSEYLNGDLRYWKYAIQAQR